MNAKIFSIALLLVFSALVRADISDGGMSPDNPLRRQMLYAPFRESYMNEAAKKFKSKQKKKSKCVFCADIEANNDAQRLLVERFEHCVVFLNLFPYQRGQILIIPNAHVKDLASLSSEARFELMEIISAVPEIFREFLGAVGTNVGINFGSIAGASKPDHLHIHALPRFECDHKSYIQLLCETHVVQWDLNKLYKDLKPAFSELKEKLCPNLLRIKVVIKDNGLG